VIAVVMAKPRRKKNYFKLKTIILVAQQLAALGKTA
jgi:hypothetical protein